MKFQDPPPDLLGALLRLREALATTALTLEVPAIEQARTARRELVDQLEDYVLPRLIQIDAPLLTVVGGSTGAGKSTLVNSIVGRRVTQPGVLRPTTRSPVLVHNPADAEWFEQDRILPDLARTTAASLDPGALQLVAVDTLPPGLAILDAPDIDSVEKQNRVLAAQLLAAADLWLFVTSAARYADLVPWDFLKAAADRSTAVAIVLDRTQPESVRDVAGHLARMLSVRRLGDSPLFTVAESAVDSDGLLPDEAVTPIRAWLQALAADADARSAVVRRTLDGALRSLARRTSEVAGAADEQESVATRLRRDVDDAYGRATKAIEQATQDGTLLRGEVLSRWQEYVGTGELLKSLEHRVGKVRDRVTAAMSGRPPATQQLTVAVESGLETLILEHAEEAAERAEASWRSVEAGERLCGQGRPNLGRASRGFRAHVERTVREWQQGVLDMVGSEGAERRNTARVLAFGVNGIGVALMIVVFSQTAGLTGGELGIAGGTALVGQKVLEALFGDQAVRSLVERANTDLQRRVAHLMTEEKARFWAVLDPASPPSGQGATLRDLAYTVEAARIDAGAA